MPRKIFKRFLPDPAKIKENRWIALCGSKIHDSEMWHLTKHSVAGAFFIGVFCAFLPIPGQMLLAAALATLFKRNLALAVALVFLTNPITMPPIFYFNYLVGSWLMHDPTLYSQLEIEGLWGWLTVNFDAVGKPLIIGSLVCGLVFGYLSYLAIHLFWIWQVKSKWQQRKILRRKNSAIAEKVAPTKAAIPKSDQPQRETVVHLPADKSDPSAPPNLDRELP